MSLTSYRAAPPRAGIPVFCRGWFYLDSFERCFWRFLVWFGGDLLSHVLRRSTIGATALNFRVRDGIGCFARAVTTKPEKKPQHQALWALVFRLAAFDCFRERAAFFAMLLLDQIKPVGQLVPVS